ECYFACMDRVGYLASYCNNLCRLQSLAASAVPTSTPSASAPHQDSASQSESESDSESESESAVALRILSTPWLSARWTVERMGEVVWNQMRSMTLAAGWSGVHVPFSIRS
ncbi:hypothetical protein OC844_006838, partial [Tilletia horrida]